MNPQEILQQLIIYFKTVGRVNTVSQFEAYFSFYIGLQHIMTIQEQSKFNGSSDTEIRIAYDSGDHMHHWQPMTEKTASGVIYNAYIMQKKNHVKKQLTILMRIITGEHK